MTDVQWLRWCASLPTWRHQPIYEALRMNEIADHLANLEGRDETYQRIILNMLDFICFDGNGDLAGATHAMEEVARLMDSLKVRVDPVVMVKADVAVDDRQHAVLAAVLPTGTWTQGEVDPDVVEADHANTSTP